MAHLRVDALPGGVQHTPGKAGMPTPGVSPLPPGAGRRGATAEAVQAAAAKSRAIEAATVEERARLLASREAALEAAERELRRRMCAAQAAGPAQKR